MGHKKSPLILFCKIRGDLLGVADGARTRDTQGLGMNLGHMREW